MQIIKKILFQSLITLLLSSMMFGGGKSTYDFLRQDVSARAAALGGSFVTIQNDPNTLFYNPAGIATLRSTSVSFGFFKHLIDINSGHAAFAMGIPNFGNIAAGIVYVNYGDFDETTEEGQNIGTFSAEDIAATVGYAMRMDNGIEYGISTKFIFSSIAGYHSSGAAIDFGLRYTVSPNGLVLGASVLNLGTQFDPYINTSESLPLDVRVGASIYPEHLPAVLLVGFSKLNDSQNDFIDHFKSFLIGVEFNASENFALRLGYNNEQRKELKIGSSAGLAGFSLGAGIKADMYLLDYSFNSLGKIGAVHRVSLGLSF